MAGVADIIRQVRFDKDGLVPAIAQEGLKGRILMMAWMNRKALKLTLTKGVAVYFSRSRNKLWRKGEESGHVQVVREVRIDCDGDVVLMAVTQKGPGACHTGHRYCFYRRRKGGKWVEVERVTFDPKAVYARTKARG